MTDHTYIPADLAQSRIAAIHQAVTTGRIDLDAASLGRLLAILKHQAMSMVCDQRASSGDPVMTLHLLALLENAELALPDACEEARDDIHAWQAQQARLRMAYRSGQLVGADRYQLIDSEV